MGGGEAPGSNNPTGVHPDVSDMFFNADHTDIVPAKGEKEEKDHLGYSVEGLKAKATQFVESLKRMGASHVPDVGALIKDFHDRH